MSLERWLPNRVAWLLAPPVLGHACTVAAAGPWALSVDEVGLGRLQVLLLITVGLTLALELGFVGLCLSAVPTFRGLVSSQLAITPEARLRALGELRRLPARAAALSFVGWLLGAALLALGLAALGDVALPAALRLSLVIILFAPLATVLVAVLLTRQVHEASDRLSEGLAPHEIIAAAPGIDWSVRGRAVGFTLLLTVMPTALLADVAWSTLEHAPALLAAAPPEARALLAERLATSLSWRLAGLGVVAVLFAVAAAAWAGASIARPMQRLADEARKLASGQLDRPVVIAADGEVWRVTAVFATLHERLAALVAQVRGAGARVQGATQSLQTSSSRTDATTSSQAAALNETSATTEELARSARQIAASAASVEALARRTLEAADAGQADAAAFQAAVDRMKQDNRSIAAAVDRLQRRVQQIGRIVELINAVADRSDLLALSAELEGTRAGDVGRGFSLVGAEMRRLAENVLESTAEVEELIAEIRDATVRTAEATERGSALTERGTALADDVTAALVQVGELAQQTAEQVRTIALSTQQQQSGTDQLAEAMGEILTGTQAEVAATQRLTGINQRLIALASSLHQAVSRFSAEPERGP